MVREARQKSPPPHPLQRRGWSRHEHARPTAVSSCAGTWGPPGWPWCVTQRAGTCSDSSAVVQLSCRPVRQGSSSISRMGSRAVSCSFRSSHSQEARPAHPVHRRRVALVHPILHPRLPQTGRQRLSRASNFWRKSSSSSSKGLAHILKFRTPMQLRGIAHPVSQVPVALGNRLGHHPRSCARPRAQALHAPARSGILHRCFQGGTSCGLVGGP